MPVYGGKFHNVIPAVVSDKSSSVYSIEFDILLYVETNTIIGKSELIAKEINDKIIMYFR